MLGEELSEIGRVIEAEIFGDMNDRRWRVRQISFRFEHHAFVHNRERRETKVAPAHAAQVRDRHTKLTRIEGQRELLSVFLLNERKEPAHEGNRGRAFE